MVTKEQIARINELHKKSKENGLNEEEQKEQQNLRRLYIDSFKHSLKSQLDNIKIVSPEEYGKINKENIHKHDENCGCSSHEHNHNHNHKPKLKH